MSQEKIKAFNNLQDMCVQSININSFNSFQSCRTFHLLFEVLLTFCSFDAPLTCAVPQSKIK